MNRQPGETPLAERLLGRCTFAPPGSAAVAALSGGPDSTALVALAVRHGLVVEAVHVHHGLRPDADRDAETAIDTAAALGVPCRVERVDLADGSNLEERARLARIDVLGADAMTGHTADDQAETVLLALLRGTGARGIGAMRPGPRHPLLGLRRAETQDLCRDLGLRTVVDPTNDLPRFRRNRIRHEVLPLLDAVSERDVTPLLTRAADSVRDDADLLDALATELDPCDAPGLAAAPPPLARRSIRSWLTVDGHPPDRATVERVLDVAAGRAVGCDVGGGRTVRRTGQRLRLDGAES